MGPWAGESIICVGQDTEAGDYPPGMLTKDDDRFREPNPQSLPLSAKRLKTSDAGLFLPFYSAHLVGNKTRSSNCVIMLGRATPPTTGHKVVTFSSSAIRTWFPTLSPDLVICPVSWS